MDSMAQLSCRSCSARIEPANVNVAADTALCVRCGSAFRFSELLGVPDRGPGNISDPPTGAGYQTTPGGFEAYAILRSWYALLGIPAATMATAFATGLLPEETMPVAARLLSGLIALAVWAYVGAGLFGRIAIRRDGSSGTIRTGWGRIGWTQRFEWDSIASATEAIAKGGFTFEMQPGAVIVLLMRPGVALRHIRFGSTLNDERRWFLLAAIRRELIRSAAVRRS